MQYSINNERNALTLKCNTETRERLRELLQEGGFTRQHEYEMLEGLISNSDLNWIDPSDTGDMTDAPLLGIVGDDVRPQDREAHPPCYGWLQYAPILERWGYPHYALRSFLQDLMEAGEATFINHW